MTPPTADTIEALFSICLATDPRRPPEGLSLMPQPIELGEAVRIVQSDSSGLGRSRRLRVIARLAAAGVPGVYDDELKNLAAPLSAIDEIRRADAPSATAIERRVYERVAEIEDGLARCPRLPPQTTATIDPRSGIVTSVTTTAVKRPLAEVRAILDPKNWDRCFSLFFAKAFTARQVNHEYPTDADGNALEKGGAPLPGCPWQDVLFEHVQLRYAGLTAFKSLLEVTCAANECTYALRTSLNSTIGPSRMEGGVQVDQGRITWRESGDWVNITATKSFKVSPQPGFPSPRWLNYLTCLNLEMMGDTLHDGLCGSVVEGCP